jgi:hypothetical protein
MIQRFLLDRIDTKATASPISRQHYLVAQPLTHKAKPALAFVQFTEARTQSAFNAPIREHCPPATGIFRLP